MLNENMPRTTKIKKKYIPVKRAPKRGKKFVDIFLIHTILNRQAIMLLPWERQLVATQLSSPQRI